MPRGFKQTIRFYFHEFSSAAWEVIKLPFWLFGLGWKRFWALGTRRVILLFVAAIVVTVVALTAFVEATSQPGFCVSCHFMKPYFDSWEISDHKDVPCIKCHIPPGLGGTVRAKFMAVSMVTDYWTGVYKRSKPWAEIEDASCLRGGCHETRLLKGKVDFKSVTFDHVPHLTQSRRDRQLRCTSCHGQIVQGQHITVTEGTCFLCHFKPDKQGQPTDLARCTHCHQPPTGPVAADSTFDHTQVLGRGVNCLDCHATAVAGDGYVAPERCNSCHAKLEHIQRYDDLDFVHQKHVTEHKVDCLNCHVAIRHGREALTGENTPNAQCTACHQAEAAVWKGELPGLPTTPSRMARVGMNCTSCHVEPLHNPRSPQSKPVCTPCHEGGYDALWPQWNAPLMRAVDGMMTDARRLTTPGGDTLRQALALYREGNPAHDPDLILVLRERLGGSAQSAGACASCHPAAAEATPLWNGNPVPHRAHAEAGLQCEQCHDTAGREHHGHLKITGDDCNACHHKNPAATCGSCHNYQQQVYSGKLNLPNAAASNMAAADVTCDNCHTMERGRVRRADANACVGCHDASYADSLRAWQQGGDALAARVKARLKTLNLASDSYRRYRELQVALERDGSRGAHNKAFFNDWMQRLETTP